jgi:hypothetical protein
MPRGLQDRRLRDPLTFSREEWQQARRVGLDPREIKTVLRQCWETSDNRAAFERALKERGFWLARGDHRGFVAIDYLGEVYSLSRYAGVKVKELAARLGDREQLRSAADVKIEIAKGMTRKLETFIADARSDAKQRFAMMGFRKKELVAGHKDERSKLWARHERRWLAEANERAQRLPRGFSGIWHRLTGQYAKIKSQNEQETLKAWQRDRAEKDALIFKQLEERQALQKDIKKQRALVQEELLQLRKDVRTFLGSENFERDREKADLERQRRRSRPRLRLDR